MYGTMTHSDAKRTWRQTQVKRDELRYWFPAAIHLRSACRECADPLGADPLDEGGG
jgi:hypothetical protein